MSTYSQFEQPNNQTQTFNYPYQHNAYYYIDDIRSLTHESAEITPNINETENNFFANVPK